MKAITQAIEKRINDMIKRDHKFGETLKSALDEMKSSIGRYGASIKEMKQYGVTLDNDTQIKVPVVDGEAEYRVGIDIPAGEHTFVSTADEDSIMCASVTVRSDSTHDMGTIITSDFFTGEYHILLEDGQYVELSQCTLLEEGK